MPGGHPVSRARQARAGVPPGWEPLHLNVLTGSDKIGQQETRRLLTFRPTAQIAVMGSQGAANIVHRKTLAAAAGAGEDVDALRAKLQQEYEDTLCNPYQAAERG